MTKKQHKVVSLILMLVLVTTGLGAFIWYAPVSVLLIVFGWVVVAVITTYFGSFWLPGGDR